MVTEDQKQQLLKAACNAREKAYARYSGYPVGAAVLAADGQIFTGVNVENASFGLTICAERSAVFSAVTAGVRRIDAVAVCTENAGSPCGACRQVLSEFGGDMLVLRCDAQGHVRETNLLILLPDQFGPEHLPEFDGSNQKQAPEEF
jgi:cytidine deaminase